jgi:hypothetical protein
LTAVSHFGRGDKHMASVVQPAVTHWPSAFPAALHICPLGQPLRPVAVLQPGMQMPTAPLQTTPDIGPPHSLSPSPSAQPQYPRLVRHWGLAPLHRSALAPEHSVQAPASGPAVWQAGNRASLPVHSASLAQATHVCVCIEQSGRSPLQSALVRQPTHTPAVVLQTGVAPLQSVSAVHPRQVFVVASQNGLPIGQVALLTHSTHLAAATSHTGLAPVHRVVLVAEHSPQAPVPWHTGSSAGHSGLLWQARHILVVASQTGVVGAPAQSAFVMHPPQSPVVTLHWAAPPGHFVELVAEHCVQRPLG